MAKTDKNFVTGIKDFLIESLSMFWKNFVNRFILHDIRETELKALNKTIKLLAAENMRFVQLYLLDKYFLLDGKNKEVSEQELLDNIVVQLMKKFRINEAEAKELAVETSQNSFDTWAALIK